MEDFSFDVYMENRDQYCKDVATKLGVSYQVASDIIYLRSRSRWAQRYEQELIDAYKTGNPIKSNDVKSGKWPYDR